MVPALRELVRQGILPANSQGRSAEKKKEEVEVVEHNNKVVNIKSAESIILFLVTLIVTPISREIAVRIPEIWTIICIPAILAGLTVSQVLDLVIFCARFETSQKNFFKR